MDVQVCAADTAGFDLDEDIVVSEFGEIDFDDIVFLRLGVPVRGVIWLVKLNGINH